MTRPRSLFPIETGVAYPLGYLDDKADDLDGAEQPWPR